MVKHFPSGSHHAANPFCRFHRISTSKAADQRRRHSASFYLVAGLAVTLIAAA
jgi:hypothetical protein